VKAVLSLLTLSMLMLPAESPGGSIDQILIIEKGVYRAKTIKKEYTSRGTGAINTVHDAKLIRSATTVPGQIGVRFGFRFVALGKVGRSAELKVVIRFPPGGLREPRSGAILFETEYPISIPIGSTVHQEYHFENDWEIVPGVWRFELWSAQRKLAEQRFCVVGSHGSQHMKDDFRCLTDIS